jgi:hypothetical protein
LGFYKELISKGIVRVNVGILGWLLRECLRIDGSIPLSQAQESRSRRVQYVPELLLHLEPAARFAIKVDDIYLLNPGAVPRSADTECSTILPRQEPPKGQPESKSVTDSC